MAGESLAAEGDALTRLVALLEDCYREAAAIVDGQATAGAGTLASETREQVERLAAVNHSARGVALTLLAYKAVAPAQDIRSHKADHPGGFSARNFDTKGTIPFLISKSLPRSVETHWLSQTFSFAGPYLPGTVLKTQPKAAGPLLVDVVNAVNSAGPKAAQEAVTTILVQLIRIRNANKVVLTRPKELPIHAVKALVERHITRGYRHNAPRLPQLVIYAVYQALLHHMGRYSGAVLEPLERMKSADRKRGTIGDVVVARSNVRIEAVEIKHEQPIQLIHVAEAIDKVRAESVTRYYLLSNRGIAQEDAVEISRRKEEFLKQNGCEIIVNGLLDTLTYYLRLLPNTTEFLFNYADLLETDEDTSYEHRIAWNECCEVI